VSAHRGEELSGQFLAASVGMDLSRHDDQRVRALMLMVASHGPYQGVGVSARKRRRIAVPPHRHCPACRDGDVVGVQEHDLQVGEQPTDGADVLLHDLIGSDESRPTIAK